MPSSSRSTNNVLRVVGRGVSRGGFVGVVLCGLLATPSVATAQETILILFDASYSMRHYLYDHRKIDIAKDGLREVIEQRIEPTTRVGIRLLAHRDALDPCAVTDLAVAPEPGAGSRVVNRVAELTPRGTETPLAAALEAVKGDLADLEGSRRVVLLTDGVETCGGDPVAVARELGALGVKVDVVGIGAQRRVQQFESIAAASAGSYVQARSAARMNDALGQLFAPPPASPAPASPETPAMSTSRALAVDLQVILDASGSMAGRVDAAPKIDLARRALGRALERVPADRVMIAFRAYGHRVPREDEAASCLDTELIEPFALANHAAVGASAARVAPTGQTPIALSLERAADDLRERPGFQHFILLLSDGLETCGGDPVATANRLRAEGIEVVIHTVGFDVDDEAERQLRAIASATGGRYLSARDYEALADSVASVTEEVERASARVEAEKPRNPIAGGPSIGEAVPIEPGWYTLDQELPRGDYAYFSVPLGSGQLLTYGSEVSAFVRGTSNPASIYVVPFDEDGTEIRNQRLGNVGDLGQTASARLLALEDRVVVLGVGAEYNPTHEDSRFEVAVVDRFDVDLGRDVPAAGVALPESPFAGYLGLDDDVDRYVSDRPLDAGTRVAVRVTADDPEFALQVTLVDQGGRRVARSTAGRTPGPATVEVTLSRPVEQLQVVITDRNIRSQGRLSRYHASVEIAAAP